MQHTVTTYRGYKFGSLKSESAALRCSFSENKIYVTLKSCHRGEKNYSRSMRAAMSFITKANAGSKHRLVILTMYSSSYEIHEAWEQNIFYARSMYGKNARKLHENFLGKFFKRNLWKIFRIAKWRLVSLIIALTFVLNFTFN